MNGAVYISFFQGQLESVLEQVVQLAVQEISKTVGASLNALLLETAVKETENRRLRLQLQARESRGRAAAEDGAPAGAAKAKAGDGRRTKPEAGGQSGARGVAFDTRRLEQRGRVVGEPPLSARADLRRSARLVNTRRPAAPRCRSPGCRGAPRGAGEAPRGQGEERAAGPREGREPDLRSRSGMAGKEEDAATVPTRPLTGRGGVLFVEVVGEGVGGRRWAGPVGPPRG